MTDPNKKEGFSQAHKGLYEGLNEQGLYTKSYEEFSMQFSTPESQKALFDAVSGQGLYTKSPDEFYSQFFNVKKKTKRTFRPFNLGQEPHSLSWHPIRKGLLRGLPQIRVRVNKNRVEIRVQLQ